MNQKWKCLHPYQVYSSVIFNYYKNFMVERCMVITVDTLTKEVYLQIHTFSLQTCFAYYCVCVYVGEGVKPGFLLALQIKLLKLLICP